MDQEPQDADKKIDINKILLPNKEVHSPANAQRINAGALLEQEQTAAKEGMAPRVAAAEQIPPTMPPKEVSSVQALETYQSDIASLVEGKNVSIVSIAAAEAERRGAGGGNAQNTIGGRAAPDIKTFFTRFSMITAGVVLLVLAVGVLGYVYLRPTTIPVVQGTLQTGVVSFDKTKNITVSSGELPNAILGDLDAARRGVSLSSGLMEKLLIVQSSSTPSGSTLGEMDMQAFLNALVPNIPQKLLRTIQQESALGVHSQSGNQAFLVLRVDSYEQAFSGMLEWENTLGSDLVPLFNTQSLQTGFIDKIIENHDARVLEDQSGTIVLLWTFLDRNTLVITTNNATLHEIISRVQNAPTTPQS